MLILAPLVAYWEGYIPRTYADPIGIPTSCYGHVGPENTPGREFSREECDELLADDLAEANAHVRRCIVVPMLSHQEAALTSAAYNAGPKIVCGSTLQRLANAGQWPQACAQLSRWVYAGGNKLRGLERRRAHERALCEGREP